MQVKYNCHPGQGRSPLIRDPGSINNGGVTGLSVPKSLLLHLRSAWTRSRIYAALRLVRDDRVWLGLALAVMMPLSACAQDSDKTTLEEELNATVKTAQIISSPWSPEELAEISAQAKEKQKLQKELLAINPTDPLAIACTGVAKQGGAVLCQTSPNAKVKIARSEADFYYESADANGRILVGFDRDETKNFVEVAGDRITFDIKPREYDTSRIDGLPPSQVSTFTDAQLKRIRASTARKAVGFSSRAKDMGFKDGFISPVAEYTKTTNFGAQRILNGEPKKPHYGVDMAAPVGTPIVAPADGIVSLADDDLYFEGAMVLLDHGQGLISMYLHVNEIMVEDGQAVKQGEQIATVGSKGRSTGPHLCWRLKWRNRNLDPELLTEWPQNAETSQ